MTQRGKYIKPRAQKYLDYKQDVGWAAKAAGVKLTDKKVATEIDVYVAGRAGDWDNYAKSICDGLNGVAWVDDRQVVDGRVRLHSCRKVEQRAEVVIREVR
ncbi:MAG: RusA family crossover junction endodeoxyribonuclease [Firmicutes bacterium]|nr:RusA family crossover junction endodeoxyribonuclease [Bacillota bacterium]